MKYARIESGIVAELLETDGDIAAMFHPSIQWVSADSSVAVGDVYSAGKFARPAAPAPVVPQSVSPLQARIALDAAGLLDQVTAAVNAADKKTQLAWEFATAIERGSEVVAALAGALKLTDAQLDALFTLAAALRV